MTGFITMTTKRDKSIDISKGIGMICVIAGHMQIQYINQIVYTFHMPLFLIASGYLLRTDLSFQFVKKKAKALLLPYLITAVVMMLINLLFPSLQLNMAWQEKGFINIVWYWMKAILYASGSNTNCFGLTLPFIGEIWFLVSLFFALLIVNYVGSRKYGTFAVIVLAFLGVFTSEITWLPFSIQAAALSSLFVQTGWLIKKYNIRDAIRKKSEIRVILLIIWAISLGLTFFTRTHMSLVRCELPHGIVDILGAISASLLILDITRGQKTEKNSLVIKFLLFYGATSLIIMCVHYIDACILPLQKLYDSYMPSNNIAALLFVLVCLIIRITYTACISKGIKVLIDNRH